MVADRAYDRLFLRGRALKPVVVDREPRILGIRGTTYVYECGYVPGLLIESESRSAENESLFAVALRGAWGTVYRIRILWPRPNARFSAESPVRGNQRIKDPCLALNGTRGVFEFPDGERGPRCELVVGEDRYVIEWVKRLQCRVWRVGDEGHAIRFGRYLGVRLLGVHRDSGDDGLVVLAALLQISQIETVLAKGIWGAATVLSRPIQLVFLGSQPNLQECDPPAAPHRSLADDS